MVAIIHKRSWRDFDWVLALLAIGIVAFGTLQIRYAQPTEAYWIKQLIGLAIGLVAMLAIAFTDYRRLLNIAPAFYIFGLLLLAVVLFPGVGLRINGQRAWIKVPGIGQFQPSEFVKVTTAMMLARYFGKNRIQTLALKEVIVGGLILALPIGLILLEPDVGSVLIGYHTWQSILTVGEGGLLGSHSSSEHSQSSLKFLPEPHTDFIYAVTAENYGFTGCVLVLVAYAVLLSRLITGARRAPDRMGMLVIMAVVGGLTFQIFINIGMALGVSPVIGVPLPLMSAGLASLIATFIAIGFAISVQLRRFVN